MALLAVVMSFVTKKLLVNNKKCFILFPAEQIFSVKTALLFFKKRKVRDSNPRYDVMRTPHFECGSFDHSDNSPDEKACKGTTFFAYNQIFLHFSALFGTIFAETSAKGLKIQ